LTASAPDYGVNFMIDLSGTNTVTPTGWANNALNKGAAGTYNAAAICVASGAMSTLVSEPITVAAGAVAWLSSPACPSGGVAISGGVDTNAVTSLLMAGFAPIVAGGFSIDKASGQYAAPNNWLAGVRNESSLSKVFKVGSLCVNPIPTTLVIEFYNSAIKHYFRTANAAEATAIDGGAAGAGWTRTGDNFTASVAQSSGPGVDICRFYTRIANSHFYTGFADECASLKSPTSGWIYESLAFKVEQPSNIGCPLGRTPVYRVYNNRGGNVGLQDANHRFTTRSTEAASMVATQGWVNEGIAFCALQ
jgi:Repeat of unknown function (DUF5648)